MDQATDMGLINRIVGIFLWPEKANRAIAARPRWVVPAVLLIILFLAFSYFVRPVAVEELSSRLPIVLEEKGVPSERIDQIIENIEQTPSWKSLINPLVGTLFGFFVWPLIWLFISNVVLGAEAKYGALLGVNVYRYFIPALGNFIKLPIMLSQRTLNVHFSIATFLPEEQRFTFLYRFLMQVDVFNIWSIAVLSIGIAVISKKSANSVWPWVGLSYALWWIVLAGLMGLSGM